MKKLLTILFMTFSVHTYSSSTEERDNITTKSILITKKEKEKYTEQKEQNKQAYFEQQKSIFFAKLQNMQNKTTKK